MTMENTLPKIHCPKCKSEKIFVIAMRVATRIPLCHDGFSTMDAEFFDTEDELVECDSCNHKGGLHTFGFD